MARIGTHLQIDISWVVNNAKRLQGCKNKDELKTEFLKFKKQVAELSKTIFGK